MKRILTLLSLLMLGVFLVSCEKTLPSNLPAFKDGDSEEVIKEQLEKRNIDFSIQYEATDNETKDGNFSKYGEDLLPGTTIEKGITVTVFIFRHVSRDLMISKYHHNHVVKDGEMIQNRALEIYNPTNKEVNLTDFSIVLFYDGSSRIGNRIKLEGKLGSKETFTIVNPLSQESLLEVADLISEKLDFDGNEAITIVNKTNMTVDIIGVKGWALFHLNNKGLVRKPNIEIGNDEYKTSEWTTYAGEYPEIILNKTYPLAPPTLFTLNPDHLEIPFETVLGTVKVSFISNNDGDTAQFKVIDESQAHLSFEGDERVRFIGVDTKEMSSSNPVDRAHAVAASNYVYQLLKDANEIYLQHDPAGSTENYGRRLALIWADGQLVNYLVVKNGHSVDGYSDKEPRLIYEGISLKEWFTNAETEAKEQQIGIWS